MLKKKFECVIETNSAIFLNSNTLGYRFIVSNITKIFIEINV